MSTGRPTGSVLVTGAARGIGLAIADRFLAGGWRVGMVDLDGDAVTEAARGRAGAVPGVLDVRDEDQWRAALSSFCVDGRLDVLVNNAGVLASGPFGSMDVEMRGPHRAVGRQIKVLAAAAAVTPDWVNRLVNARLAR